MGFDCHPHSALPGQASSYGLASETVDALSAACSTKTSLSDSPWLLLLKNCVWAALCTGIWGFV
jgi:hypothetical protein